MIRLPPSPSANRGAAAMGVSGNQSTVKNTNTCASIKLPSTPSGYQRQDHHEEQKYPQCVVGQGNFPGIHLDNSGYSGGSTAAKKEMGIKAGEYSSASGSSGHSQQNDVASVERGGLPSDNAKNVSFNSKFGSSEDPSRESINQFQRSNAGSAYSSGHPEQKRVDDQNQYEQLESDQHA
ncbi:hypothetical protein N7463_009901 [Penicillium fimorum]|uniref:Uncharacterized protein n=1 Tax=Penicillium fimorum TaxID=1882269 RepID=A0A9W9XJ05_9EURO|nr:hypothetical protein N7463_009901 [Penicillium fimorum]